jgi:hypothetical protein
MNQPLDQDKELAAIKAILGALDGLDGDAIQRVLDYVFGRLSIPRGARPDIFARVGDAVLVGEVKHTAPADRIKSIRDLKEEKRPSSANQMAALVAYYLTEIVDEVERKPTITSADLEKYFKQAGFKLPKKLAMALPNAAAAGYFDSAGSGQYRLNPVGYNLVAHALPRDPDPKKN